MSGSEETAYGMGDYIGDLLAYGVSEANADKGWSIRNGVVLTQAAGKTLMQRMTSVLEQPKLFALWSLIELVLTIAWLRNPWPFPKDSVSKHAGALEVFVLLYFCVSVLYFLFFKAKQTAFAGDNPGPAQQEPGVYGDEKGFLGGLAAKVYATFGSMIIMVLAIIGTFMLVRRFDILYYLLTYGMTICIVVLGIALAYLLLKPLFKKRGFSPGGVLGIVWNFILFIPCLAISAIEWFLRQESGKKLDGTFDPFYARDKLVWTVILVEIGLVALRFALPYIFNKLVTHDGKHLLGDPVYLNDKRVLGTYKDLYGNVSAASVDAHKYRYSLSERSSCASLSIGMGRAAYLLEKQYSQMMRAIAFSSVPAFQGEGLVSMSGRYAIKNPHTSTFFENISRKYLLASNFPV
tara:strand:- start:933 stop:2150 length:1218 start_codon:yes stop_codon:yes gene_type:complete